MERSIIPEWPIDPGYLRMLWLYWHLVRMLALRRVVVSLVRNRVMGWNGLDGAVPDPVVDARQVLTRITDHDPSAPIVLVGHSMGGRTAIHVADHPNVVGVVALAPWIEPDDSVAPLAGRSLFIAHGTLDAVTSAAESYAFAARAREAGVLVARVEVRRDGHAMVRHFRVFHAWATAACAQMLGVDRMHGTRTISTLLAGAGEDGLVGEPSLGH